MPAFKGACNFAMALDKLDLVNGIDPPEMDCVQMAILVVVVPHRSFLLSVDVNFKRIILTLDVVTSCNFP